MEVLSMKWKDGIIEMRIRSDNEFITEGTQEKGVVTLYYQPSGHGHPESIDTDAKNVGQPIGLLIGIIDSVLHKLDKKDAEKTVSNLEG